MRKKILNEDVLRRFYNLLSVSMTDFDCGDLCAPENGGVPLCCDSEVTYPVPYRDEYSFLRRKSNFWKRMSLKNPEAKKIASELHENSVLAKCPGPAKCKRSQRAIVCRIYPFEPYLECDGTLLGLTFNYDMEDRCPLIGKPESMFNPGYVKNSILMWRELLLLMPEEYELYKEESAKLRRKFARKNRKIDVFCGKKKFERTD